MGLVLVALVIVLISAFWKVWMELFWRPYVVTEAMRKQGVRGPPYKLWKGSFDEFKSIDDASRDIILEKSSHDITVRVLAHFRKWTKQYGSTVLYWYGTQPKICLTDPEMIKEVLIDKTSSYEKFDLNSNFLALLGRGLVFSEGEEWARHRRIISPAFGMNRVKMMTTTVAELTKVALERWYNQTVQADNQQKEIEVYHEFDVLIGDVIAHTLFGSSYKEEEEIFMAQRDLLSVVLDTSFQMKIFKYLPTKINLYKWELEKKVRNKIISIIQKRLDTKDGEYGNDLLGILIESSQNDDIKMLSMDDVIEDCKAFFFAGYETTSILLAWAMFLLSTNLDWQEKVREEVIRECAIDVPTVDVLNRLNLVNMVILETLRLYCPVYIFARKTIKDVSLGNLTVPKDTGLVIPVSVIHRIEEIWGTDANEFNPARFENGVSKAATHPNALLAFSSGPKNCIGQNLVMVEAKIVLAMILQRFRFCISEDYKHAPSMFVSLRPKYGIPIMFKPLHV